MIAITPAASLLGVAAQLEVVLEYNDYYRPRSNDVSQDVLAMRNMRDTLARLTGGRAAA